MESAASSQTGTIARSAGTVGIAVFCSRILGLIREQVLANFFGAGLAMDAFVVAFRIPNLLRDLFAEGALSAAFVTVLTDYDQRLGRAATWRLANNVLIRAASPWPASWPPISWCASWPPILVSSPAKPASPSS